MNVDKRFSRILKDPRFKRMPRKAKRVKIDSRFKSMFSDSKFKTKYSVDKRGRPILRTSKEDLKKYYNIEEEDDACEVESSKEREVSQEKRTENEISKTQVCQALVDSDSESDNDDDVDFSDIRGGAVSASSSDEEDEQDGNNDMEIEHDWGELDKEATRKDDAITSRLAVCNMDWDKVTADDLFVLFNSFGGSIKSVKIYLSEFGKQRLAEEDLNGPVELKNDDKEEEEGQEEEDANNVEGTSFHMEKLRKYQLNRMKYYYSIVECDSMEAANEIYDNCDGIEYELGATRLDLRFVPADTTFDDEPKQIATELPMLSNYQPTVATNSALQQSTVRLTWDETDPKRLEMTMRKFNKDEIADMDFNAYLATSSEEEERDDDDITSADKNDVINEDLKDEEDEKVMKYRSLLQEIESKESKENDDKHMEISWEPALSESTDKIIKNKIEKAKEDNMTPWEKYLNDKKKKSKGKLKKGDDENADQKEDDDDNEDDEREEHFEEEEEDEYVPTGADDPFFVHSDDESGKKEKKRNKRGKKKKGKGEETEMDAQEKRELDLLMMDDKDDKQHFNMKEIMENEKRKKKGKNRKDNRDERVDDFQIDVHDKRFSAIYSSPDFILDPSGPQFKKTKAMEKIIEEKQKRRNERYSKDDTDSKSSEVKSKSVIQTSLSALVSSVKSKTEQYQRKKKLKPKS